MAATDNDDWRKHRPAAVPHIDTTSEPEYLDPVDADYLNSLSNADPDEEDNEGPNLPDEFWAARSALQHIRVAAYSRSRSADAVLGGVLARVAASVPHKIQIPAIVGSPSPLSMLVAIIGRSGAGKSSGVDVATELVPITNTDILDGVPIGSGEGLVDAFFEFRTEDGDDTAKGKGRERKKVQTKHGLFASLDEGQALGTMGARQGSTLLPTLRTAWSGGTLGQQNASFERKRILGRGKYSLSAVIGFQLEHAATLLDDSIGGTPQRFTWHWAHDPTLPDEQPDWPGELDWEAPFVLDHQERYVEICTSVKQEVKARNLAITRGGVTEHNPLDAHANLVSLRVASILGILDGRLSVNEEDWRLARMIWAASRDVRSQISAAASRQARRAVDQRIAVESRVQTSVHTALDDSKHERALRSSARSVALKVHQAAGPITKNEARRAIAGKYKQHLATDVADVFDHCIQSGWIERVDTDGTERFKAGRSRPT